MGILKAFISTGAEIFIFNKYHSLVLQNELKSYLKKHNKQLEAGIKNRIKAYTIQSAITNLWFSSLRGYSPDKNELLSGLYVGSSTPIYDDLMDSHHFTHNELNNRVENLKHNDNTSLLLLNYLRQRINDTVKNMDIYQDYLLKLGAAQTQSLRQNSRETLTTDEIRKITYDKGGYATLLYRSLLSNKIIEGEENAIYQLGALLQLTNDIFDIYKDYKNKSQTLASTATNIDLLTEEFLSLKNKVFVLFSRLDYKPPNIQATLYQFMPIISRGRVCLDQLQLLQQQNKSFKIENFKGKQLICDMEKLKNIRKSFQICKEWKNEMVKSSNIY